MRGQVVPVRWPFLWRATEQGLRSHPDADPRAREGSDPPGCNSYYLPQPGRGLITRRVRSGAGTDAREPFPPVPVADLDMPGAGGQFSSQASRCPCPRLKRPADSQGLPRSFLS